MNLRVVTTAGAEPIFLTYAEVAARWRCSKATVQRRVNAGVLETVGQGSLTRVTLESVLAYESSTKRRRAS